MDYYNHSRTLLGSIGSELTNYRHWRVNLKHSWHSQFLADRQSIDGSSAFAGDIPKTRNAKVMRRVVRAAYLGEKLGDTSALENPASLDEIKRAAK